MKKEIKIDSEDLINALEDHSDSFAYFLDLENGNIVMFSKDSFEEEFDEESDDESLNLDGYNREAVESQPDRFISIEPIRSDESFNIMEDFTAALPDDLIKDRLNSALSKRKPFRHFKDELYDFPEVQKEWYIFHEEEMKKIAREWLEAYDIKFELIRKNIIKDKD